MSRFTEKGVGVEVIGTAPSAEDARIDAAVERAKIGKASVDYGPGRAESRCGVCEYFEAPDGCARVTGTIDPDAWCRLFKSKTG